MIKQKNILFGVGVTVACVLCVVCTLATIYYARQASTAVTDKLTIDQQLAAISVNVTILGGVVAMVAIVIGVAALMGWGELRNMLLRKTQDDVLGIIRALQKSGEIDSATASVLAESIAKDQVFTAPQQSSIRLNEQAPQISPDTNKEFEKYPGKD